MTYRPLGILSDLKTQLMICHSSLITVIRRSLTMVRISGGSQQLNLRTATDRGLHTMYGHLHRERTLNNAACNPRVPLRVLIIKQAADRADVAPVTAIGTQTSWSKFDRRFSKRCGLLRFTYFELQTS